MEREWLLVPLICPGWSHLGKFRFWLKQPPGTKKMAGLSLALIFSKSPPSRILSLLSPDLSFLYLSSLSLSLPYPSVGGGGPLAAAAVGVHEPRAQWELALSDFFLTFLK